MGHVQDICALASEKEDHDHLGETFVVNNQSNSRALQSCQEKEYILSLPLTLALFLSSIFT